ncbi:GlsB/YeaQ/YmgE family stress response membrane protein [Tengunoibacter tsumagoiensis]|uniref:Transglycosylase n=1 Tax=Tengunoibacter tsumagoiensis TaxID=2014871 RepID=A0A401ZW45_9CHLR|nr:GlsB/YeaQ/YmgE family stress response membrane protein [Tengunoibacter tsumagoiensis]GCE11113.1 hypothetical protein KTT_09720 [Tengunoibacter tsumagoiensis]
MIASPFVLGAAFAPGGLIGWIVVGLIAGFLAGQFMKGSGYGILGDIIVGLVGALVGGFLTNLLLPDASLGWIWTIVVAFIGACIFIALFRAVTGGRRAV